jgi:hypothetical protein
VPISSLEAVLQKEFLIFLLKMQKKKEEKERCNDVRLCSSSCEQRKTRLFLRAGVLANEYLNAQEFNKTRNCKEATGIFRIRTAGIAGTEKRVQHKTQSTSNLTLSLVFNC